MHEYYNFLIFVSGLPSDSFSPPGNTEALGKGFATMRADANRSRRVISRVLGACAFIAILISAGCTTNNKKLNQGPTITTTSASLAQADQNVAYNANVTASGGTAPFTWTILPGGPAWLSAAASATNTVGILGTPTVAGPAAFTIKITDAKGLSNTANLSITVNAPPTITTTSASLPAGTAGVAYSATVNATGGTAPFTWAITSGPAWLGTAASTSNSVTIQGTPTAGGAAIPFSIKVTDAAGGTFTAPLTLNIAPPAALAITTTQAQVTDGSIAVPYPLTAFAATGGVPPYTWSNPSGNLPPGLTLSPAGVISGIPTATQNNNTISVDVNVADSFGTTPVTNNFNITIGIAATNPCGPALGSEAVLKGQYAFLVQGYDGSGSPIALVTSFSADGAGNVAAGGDADFTDSTGTTHVTFTSASSYVVGPDHRGCVSLVTAGGTAIFRFALGGVTAGVATKGSIIEFDDASGTSNRASGILRLQTPADFVASHLQANYAFGMDGIDGVTSPGGHYAVGGSFSLSNTTGVISSLFSDIDDAGTITAPGGLTAGVGGNGLLTLSSVAPVSPSASTGRMLGSLSPDANHTYGLAIYVVNASEFFAITTDTLSATQPILSGRFIVTGAGFTNASAASTEMIHVNGTSIASGGSASGTIGILTFANGTPGTVNGNLYNSDGTTQAIAGGTYTVDPTSGRLALAGAAVYLAGPIDGISAFIIGLDNSAFFGYAEVQSPTSGYTVSSLNGNYFFGLDEMNDNTDFTQVHALTLNSAVVQSGTDDSSDQSSGLIINTADVPSASNSFTIMGDGHGSYNGFASIFVTDGTKMFLVDQSGSGNVFTVDK